jgi:hypothetical protein
MHLRDDHHSGGDHHSFRSPELLQPYSSDLIRGGVTGAERMTTHEGVRSLMLGV